MLINKAVFILFSLLSSQGFCAFFTPQQKGRGVWKVGDVESVKYETSHKKYTIALWQQSLTEGSAGLGPIVYQTSNGPGRQFDWLVQTYDFNLDESNVFFFWLFPGDASVQGNQSIASMPSSFFNITREAVSVDPSEAATSSLTSPAATSSQSTPTSTASQTDDGSTEDDNELSVASKAGIGVGAGVGALAILAAGFWLYRRQSHQQKKIEELQQQHTIQHSQWHPSQGETKYVTTGRTYEVSGGEMQRQEEPVELPGCPRR